MEKNIRNLYAIDYIIIIILVRMGILYNIVITFTFYSIRLFNFTID